MLKQRRRGEQARELGADFTSLQMPRAKAVILFTIAQIKFSEAGKLSSPGWLVFRISTTNLLLPAPLFFLQR